MKYLITFGCSWTWGAGLQYKHGMTEDSFREVVYSPQDIDKHSFRSILANAYGYKNINFAIWKSSNQKQFRLAKQFFSSEQFIQIKNQTDEIIVLWGITSTGRNEVYSSKTNQYVNLVAHAPRPTDIERELAQFYFKNMYDHEHAVSELTDEILHWNDFFNLLAIKNYWYDSFNHHQYSKDIDNFVVKHNNARDLLSQLAIQNGVVDIDNQYHTSAWSDDTNRLNILVEKGILNPFSFHPTRLGHQQIAQMFKPIFDN